MRLSKKKKKKQAGLFPKQIFRHPSNIIFRLQSFIGRVRQSEAKSQQRSQSSAIILLSQKESMNYCRGTPKTGNRIIQPRENNKRKF